MQILARISEFLENHVQNELHLKFIMDFTVKQKIVGPKSNLFNDACMKFLIRPQDFRKHSERRLVLNNVTYINWNDDDDNDLLVSLGTPKTIALIVKRGKKVFALL